LVTLVIPAVAAAGTYTWDLNSNFTATAPGANPDKDSYGGTPWSYEEGSGTKLPTFGTGINGGLAGWHDSGNVPLVAINNTGGAINNGGRVYPSGKVVLEPSSGGKPAVVAWTSPLAGTVSISGSINPDKAGGLTCPNSSWALKKNGANQQTGSGAGTISRSVSVQPGDRITLETTPGFLAIDSSCEASSVTFTIGATLPAPAVTLASPANGAILGGQPTFTGSAGANFGDSSTVTINVYAGASTGGALVQSITTTRSGNTYSTGPTAPLLDGLYTAQAVQANGGDVGQSAPTTFHLQNAAPTVTLDSLGTRPLTTGTPTFTGIAAHSSTVSVAVYPGTSTSGSPTQLAVGSSGSDGHFSLTLGRPLSDGQYTAVAGDSTGGLSLARQFRVKAHPPAFTVTAPAAGAHTSDSQPTFTGTGGTALGDSSRVSLTLFSGGSAGGKSLGSAQATVSNGQWSLRWGQVLKLGIYTFQASQADDAGHTVTVTRSFVIVPAPNVIGSSVSISRRGIASVPIACTAPAGHVCTGNVLVLTVKRYQTVSGGPSGNIRVLFAYVRIPGGTTTTVKRHVQSDALRALRHLHGVHAKVITTLKDSGGPTKTVSAQRSIRLASH
jgi:Bacterial Ig-like domain